MKYDKLYIYAVFDLPRPFSLSLVFFLPVSKASADCDDCDGKQKTPVAASSAVDNCVDYTLMPQDTWFHKLIVKKVNSLSCFVDVVTLNTLPYLLFVIQLTFKRFWGFSVLIICLVLFRKGAGHDSVAMQAAIVTGFFSPSPLIWLVQLLLWPHLLGPRLAEASPACPNPCSCSNQASRVICTRKGLNEVPQSISSNTRYLNLQENSIQVTTLIP